MKAVRSIERAFDVLVRFIETPILEVAQLQQGSDLPRPTLYRILNTLEQKGLLSSSGDPKQYRLTYRSLEMANSYLSTLDIVAIGTRYLEGLQHLTEETVALFVNHDQSNRILVKEIVSAHPLKFSRGVGYISPHHVGSAGKVILAHLGPAAIEVHLSSINSSERAKLRAEIAAIHKSGVHISHGEVISGAVSIAAPVFTRGGTVIGSIAVFGPEARLTQRRQAEFAPEIRKAAEAISSELGFGASTPAERMGRTAVTPTKRERKATIKVPRTPGKRATN